MKNILIFILFFFVIKLLAGEWVSESVSEPVNMKKIDDKSFYVITTPDELAWFAEQVNSGKTTINAILANDIVFGNDTTAICKNRFRGLNIFNGILDGNGYSIFGLNAPYYFIEKLEFGAIRNISFKRMYLDGLVHVNRGLMEYITVFKEKSGTLEYVVSANSEGGTIDHCTYYVSANTDGSLVETNNGTISYCKIIGGCTIAFSNSSSYSYRTENAIVYAEKYGTIKYCIEKDGASTCHLNMRGISNSGIIQWSYSISNNEYWLNSKPLERGIRSTAENMQRDQFAWILNTSNGSEENSGVWTRGTDGYPTFANEDSLAIRKVVFDDDGTTSNRYTNYKGQVSFPENPEAPEGLVFSGWYNSDDVKVKPTTVFTADQTVNAIYVDASDVFWTINFYNAAPADTLLESKSYQHGSIVTYGGAAPTLASTAQYTYTFKGWDVEPTNAVEDFDYHAVYDSTVRSYAIMFINTDSSKIERASFEYGKMPSCTKIPTRAATAEWTYSHKGWKPALDYVTEAATYMAIYDSSKVEYKVTFMNGTTVIDEQMVPYGEAAVAPTNVNREGYKFVGWNNSFAKVTEALTVKALFEELIVRTVSVINADGEKIDNVKLEDGETYTLPEAPEKEGYTFDAYYDGRKKLGVAGDEISVTANITITAKYIENPKSSSSQQEIASSSSTSRNDELSSSSSRNDKSSSSSSKVKSSSSEKIEAIVATAIPQFSVQVNGRNIQISTARIGATYALFDMQGKVLLQGRVQTVNFEIPVARSGNYLIRVGNNVQRIAVK